MAKLLLPFLILWFICRAVEVLRQAVGVLRQGRARKVQRFREVFEKSGRFFSTTDLFALVYAGGAVLSYCFSNYRETAWLGAAGWYMGLQPQLTLVAMYFLISRCCIGKKWLFALFFPVSAIVFLLGILDRYGIYLLDMRMDERNPLFISTIGNINWYCGYLVCVLFVALGYAGARSMDGEMPPAEKALFYAYISIGFCTLITNGSSSGVIAFGAMMFVFLGLTAYADGAYRSRNARKILLQEMLLFSFVCFLNGCFVHFFGARMTYQEGLTETLISVPVSTVLTVLCVCLTVVSARLTSEDLRIQRGLQKLFFVLTASAVIFFIAFMVLAVTNTIYPGSIGSLSNVRWFILDDEWGSRRLVIWKIALLNYSEQPFINKIFGVGPDCMWSSVADSIRCREMVMRVFGQNMRLTNAHNEWLTILLNLGIPGLVGYAGMETSAIVRWICAAKAKKDRLKDTDNLQGGIQYCAACAFGVLAYMINACFSFQQTMGAVTMFAVMGLGEGFYRQNRCER